MTLTLNLPAQVEEAYRAEAEARGLSIDEVVREILIAERGRSAFLADLTKREVPKRVSRMSKSTPKLNRTDGGVSSRHLLDHRFD